MKYKSESYKDGIYAKVVADSISPDGIRVISFETRAPKFLDAEIEKHRMLSSNSSSDRAIPFSKLTERPYFIPQDVRLNQPGMQGDNKIAFNELEEFQDELHRLYSGTVNILNRWKHIHKQHLNRYLMAFSYQHKIITATELDNFFSLRLHPKADPAIYALAFCMKEAMDRSNPIRLDFNEWHLPYVNEGYGSFEEIPLSVARCARVSYSNHDKTDPNSEKDRALHDQLIADRHMTPLEHQLKPMRNPVQKMVEWEDGVTHMDKKRQLWSAGSRGWIQYRKLMEK